MNSQKFPKKEALFTNKIDILFNNRDFEEIANLRNEIFTNIEFYKNTKVIYKIIYSIFLCKAYEEVVTFACELKKNDIEKLEYHFFVLVSLIALDDIYMAKSYINKSKLLNNSVINDRISIDGANYSNILVNENIDEIPCMLVLNLIKQYDIEGINEDNALVYKYYEMIDAIYSFGYSNEIISFMTNIGSFIFDEKLNSN